MILIFREMAARLGIFVDERLHPKLFLLIAAAAATYKQMFTV